ncbi:MAG TPA: site-2 protease family protein [Bradyrhizobium sp.]|uniref:site-2 protease family protein n=1 Tax=Bradyrhizobium sp. TaxID=376 RepID=UPI002B960B2C|nr:site-2 protease family protein [Bradyrhizobium sp.]HLZ01119.1 site-2 protease family protein [Bradyrhizobium sp.]
MTRHNIPLGKILGIQIGLDYSWFVIFALLTWMLASSYYPDEFKHWSPLMYWMTGAATAIMLFVSVLLHELGHSVVALRYRIPVRSITLFLFGGVAQIGAEPPSAVAEFLIAIAGPLVSLALAAFFYAAQSPISGVEPLLGLAKYLAYINTALVLFNLMPGYPLDGGRVLRAVVWAITGNMSRSTLIAANVGRFFAFFLIFAGTWQIFSGNLGGGLWIALIGWFLDSAASAQIQQLALRGLLTGHRVSQAMSAHYAIIPEDLTLQQLVDELILDSGQRSFLVNRGDKTIGLITLHQIKEVPRREWATKRAAEVMLPFEQLTCTSPDAELWSALQKMDRNGVNQMPVVRAEHVVGMLSREDVITFLRTLQDFGTSTDTTTGR